MTTFPSDECLNFRFQCGINNVRNCALLPHESPSTSPQFDHPHVSQILAHARQPQFPDCPQRLDTILFQL